jgi:hypothetical protein
MLALTDGDGQRAFTLTLFLRLMSVAALALDPGAQGRVLLLVGVILGHTGASDSDLYVG